MTPEQRTQLRAICREHAGLTVTALWHLIRQAEVFTESEIDAFRREANRRLAARVVQADPALRRRFEDEGRAVLDDPFVRARLWQLIKKDLEAGEESEDP